MLLALIGDVHGHHALLARHLTALRDQHGIAGALQVGDYGFYRRFMGSGGRRALPMPVPVHVACGNHEDHRWVARCRGKGADAVWAAHNLFWQDQPSILERGGCGIGFLGGALNVDRPQRGSPRHGTSNYIVDRQARAAIDLFNRHRPPILISHSCPAGIGIGMRGNPALTQELLQFVLMRGFDPGPGDDAGERLLTTLWHGLAYRPRVWCFGHFHYRNHASIDGCDFHCLGLLEQRDTALLWDTERRDIVAAPVADGDRDARDQAP